MSIFTKAIRTSALIGAAAVVSTGLSATALAGHSDPDPTPTPDCDITLFWEDFNGYNSFPDQRPSGDPVNLGVPKTSEGADETWYGARFIKETYYSYWDNSNIDKHVAVQGYGGGGNSTPTGRVEGGAALLFKIDTTGYQNVQLSFDWRTFSAGSGDQLAVSYTTLDLSGYFGADMTNDFYADFGNSNANVNNWLDANWTTEKFGPNNSFQSALIDIDVPADSVVWVAFWGDMDYDDYGKFDNVHITGCQVPPPTTVIPEPASLGILSLGAMALLRRRRGSA